ncbi:O-antigen ligase family protein [Lutispora thermophila]|uniref:O-antigen ligase n=1 Tax=Lutispora thermophila DSM 19022 TaxID=1122184 RepID=A0A1M6CGK6_9FIRM|nr:O-antigen ligase family protein [Lutispora thermophila]SHI60152.1 O-antigen ligase [Lutispora thermophila DSM 19022]
MEKIITLCIMVTMASGVLMPPLGFLSVLGVLILFIIWDQTNGILRNIVLNKQLVIFLIFMFISVFFSNLKYSSIAFFIILILEILYYSMVIYYISKKGVNSLFNALNYIAIIASSYGIYQFISGKLQVNKHWTGYSESLSSICRVYSTLYNPNVFAAYLVISICFIICWIITMDKSHLKNVSLILCSISLIFTYSRGAFVSLLAALIIVYLIKRDNRLIIYGVLMIMFFVIFNNGTAYERIDIANINKDSSSLYRLEIWRTSFRIFMDNPIFGNGIGTLWYSISNMSSRLWGVIYHAHNLLLHFAAETGVLGLISFLWIFENLTTTSYKAVKNTEDSIVKFVALSTIGSCTAIMVHGLIDATVVLPTLSLILMNYYGLSCYALGILKLNTLNT